MLFRSYPAQCVAGTFDPPLVASAPGPYLATLQIGYLLDGKYPQYFDEVTTGWSSPRSFVIPDEADGSPLFFDYTVAYTDYVGAPEQRLLVQRVGVTPPVEGVKPAVVTPCGFDPANQYTAGNTITWVPGTYSGLPTPKVTWAWYLGPTASDQGQMVQNGGLTYQIPDDAQGKWVDEIGRAHV